MVVPARRPCFLRCSLANGRKNTTTTGAGQRGGGGRERAVVMVLVEQKGKQKWRESRKRTNALFDRPAASWSPRLLLSLLAC